MKRFPFLHRKREKPPLERFSSLSADAGRSVPEEPLENTEAVVRECRNRSASLRSYRTEIVILDKSSPPVMEGPVRYTLETVRPDRFHVLQVGWMDKREVYDEWITIGEDHFDNVGVWGRGLILQRKELNPRLAIESFLSMLESVQAPDSTAYVLDGHRFVRLDSEQVPPTLEQDMNPSEMSTILWVDGENWLPAKVEASGVFRDDDGLARLEFEQVFFDFDANISIAAPEVGLDTPQ
jgi:hypothetical protein